MAIDHLRGRNHTVSKVKQRRFNATIPAEPAPPAFVLLRHCSPSPSRNIHVLHGKIPQITQVDQLCCADTRRDKICRLCNTAVFHPVFLSLAPCIHCFTRFRYKIKHTSLYPLCSEIIIADNATRKNKITQYTLAVLRVILLTQVLCRLFAHYLLARTPLPGIIVLILNVRGFHAAPVCAYLVATPIESDDMPPRVAATASALEADFVAAEDTPRHALRRCSTSGSQKADGQLL